MTYYTIPYKSDGTCCEDCQPDPTTCSCEEGCCDPTESYTGKTMTMQTVYKWAQWAPYSAVSYNKYVYDFTGTYSGGVSFSGTETRSYYSTYLEGSSTNCFAYGNPAFAYTEPPYSYTYRMVCTKAPGGTYYDLWEGASNYTEPWRNYVAYCSSTPACEPSDGSLTDCTATYSSDCFSIVAFQRYCEEFYENGDCTGSLQSGSTGEGTITVSIA